MSIVYPGWHIIVITQFAEPEKKMDKKMNIQYIYNIYLYIYTVYINIQTEDAATLFAKSHGNHGPMALLFTRVRLVTALARGCEQRGGRVMIITAPYSPTVSLHLHLSSDL